jgi:perosamine synthetase
MSRILRTTTTASRLMRSFHQSNKKKKVISFSQPILGQEEEEAVLATLRSGRLVMGPNVEKFEEMVASFSGQKHAIAVTSGTSALSLALTVMGVDQDACVVVPAYTWVATYNAPKLLGATVRLADIDPNTFCFSPDSTKRLSDLLSQKKKDKQKQKSVIIPVHMFGNRCSSDLGEYDLVLGDGCCSFGGKDVDGKRCGNWNAIECFSFHPRKLITTGEGGMVLCSDDQFAKILRIQRDHGAYRSPEQRYQTTHGGDLIPEFPEVGYNLRLTDLQGALGVAQMKRIDMIVRQRRHVSSRYDLGLADLSSPSLSGGDYLKLPTPETLGETGAQADAERVLTMYSLQLRSQKLDTLFTQLIDPPSLSSLNPDLLKATLEEILRLRQKKNLLMSQLVSDGVTARPPMISLLDVAHIQRDHLQLTGEDLTDDLIKLKSFPGTFLASQLTFALPLHPLLSADETDHVISRVRYHFFSSFLTRALQVSSHTPHDFTIQYPIRREYFKTYYALPLPETTGEPPTLALSFLTLPIATAVISSTTATFPTSHSLLLPDHSLPSPAQLLSTRLQHLPQQQQQELLLYLHVPFCKSKCHYCNFAVDTRNSQDLRERYTTTLTRQLEQWTQLILDPTLKVDLTGIDIG